MDGKVPSPGSQRVSFGGERRRIEFATLQLGVIWCPLIVMQHHQPFDTSCGQCRG